MALWQWNPQKPVKQKMNTDEISADKEQEILFPADCLQRCDETHFTEQKSLAPKFAPSPVEAITPIANINAEWPPAVQPLIDWFMGLEPPAESFYLEPHLRVIDPEKFFATLRREIETGPSGPRAQMGSLQCDLRALQAKFHREEH